MARPSDEADPASTPDEVTRSLLAERARLAAIVDSSDDAIVGKTLEGIVTSWNAGAERLFGYAAAEMVGQPISRIVPPDCSDDVRMILASIGRGDRVDHYETQRVTKYGRRIHVSLTVSPIKDATGRVIGASKIARDITARKRDEEALRRHRATIDTLYRVGLTLSAELDLEKLLQAVTDAATRLTGAAFGAFFYDARDPEGGRCTLYTLSGAPRDAFARLGMPRRTRLFATTFEGAAVVRLDDVTRDPRYGENDPHGGVPRGHAPVRSYMAVPIVGRGDQVYGGLFLGHPQPGVFDDDSEIVARGLAAQAGVAIENARLYEAERRLRGEAEDASRAKDEFLAMLGHELRNPLAAVRNALISAELDPSCRERALGIARRGADQLARLVDDLLDVARITQGKIALNRERVRLATVVERAVETTRALVEERAHQLTLSLPREPLDVHGDQTRLEQVLVNLIGNAAKYTERGGHIELSVARAGGEAVVSVRDDGVGIAGHLLPRVFDLFTQAERGPERAPGGLGIGLTVVRRVVELHGGRVEARSEGLGKGAEFVVGLPVLPPREEVSARSFEAESDPAPVRWRILLVEDEHDVAESMLMVLEVLGHDVRLVHDGATALHLARSYRPEMMLVDIGLPGMDGYEVARRIRGDVTLSQPVLVALTGYGRAEDKQRARRAGFDHHLTKPVDIETLRGLMGARGIATRSASVH